MKNNLKICKPFKNMPESLSGEGEDVVIRKILDILEIKNGTVVDVGSWDGWHLSNVGLLIKDGFSGILIESEKSRIAESQERRRGRDDVVHFNQLVDLEEKSLNKILEQAKVSKNFEVLNIDIDSYEFWIWKNLKFKPKIVCIEFNGHRLDYDVTIPYDKNWNYSSNKDNYGASPTALFRLGNHKGYSLVSISKHNLIFCDSKYSHLFETFSQIDPSWMKETFNMKPWSTRIKMDDSYFVFNPEIS